MAVPATWAGWCLADAVSIAASIDRAAARALIEHGGVWVDRRRAQDPLHELSDGQLLALHFPPPGEQHATITPADVLHEDSSLLILNKPPGTYVTMTPWSATGDVLWAARQFLTLRDGAAPPLHLAHQLDRDTSGVLLISKDPAVNAALQDVFLRRVVEKRYLAVVAGVPTWETLHLRSGHGRGGHGLFRIYPLETVGYRLTEGNGSINLMETRLTVVERFAATALVEARPLTGRTHQIRLHLVCAGHAIVGDARYGGPVEIGGMSIGHHLLHAAHLRLPHPVTGAVLDVDAPPPPLLEEVLRRLGGASQ